MLHEPVFLGSMLHLLDFSLLILTLVTYLMHVWKLSTDTFWKGVKLILNSHVQVPMLFLKFPTGSRGLICAWAQGCSWSSYTTESTMLAECVDPSLVFCSLDLLEFLFHSLTSVCLRLFRSHCLITGACVHFLTLLILFLDHGDSGERLQKSCYGQCYAIEVLLCLSVKHSTELNTGLLLEVCSTLPDSHDICFLFMFQVREVK